MDSARDNLANSNNSLSNPIQQYEDEDEKMELTNIRCEVPVSRSGLLKEASPSGSQNHKICKVNYYFADKKKIRKFYEPSIVSIGPYHHGKFQSEETKTEKRNRLLQGWDRTSDQYAPMVEKARDCYSDIPPKWKNDEVFSEMMLLDGCFIVDLIYQLQEGRPDDTMSRGDRLASTLYDLVLVENQLPFFVLWEILGISVADDKEKCKCIQQLLSTFERKMPGLSVEKFNVTYWERTQVGHLVDLLYSLWIPSSPKVKAEVEGKKKCSIVIKGEDFKYYHIDSATDLKEAGIQFKEAKGSLFDIEFKNGKLMIPSIIVGERTEDLYHNIIAYERHSMSMECGGATRSKLAFYCNLMNRLIKSKRDNVRVLCNHGIIVNCLGDDGAVAQMFRRLAVDVGVVGVHGIFYAPLFNDINNYRDKQRSQWGKALWHELYVKSPGALAFGFIIFVLAVLQTHFAIFPLSSKGG